MPTRSPSPLENFTLSDRLLRICQGVYMRPIDTRFGHCSPWVGKVIQALSKLWDETIVRCGGSGAVASLDVEMHRPIFLICFGKLFKFLMRLSSCFVGPCIALGLTGVMSLTPAAPPALSSQSLVQDKKEVPKTVAAPGVGPMKGKIHTSEDFNVPLAADELFKSA